MKFSGKTQSGRPVRTGAPRKRRFGALAGENVTRRGADALNKVTGARVVRVAGKRGLFRNAPDKWAVVYQGDTLKVFDKKAEAYDWLDRQRMRANRILQSDTRGVYVF